MPALAVLEARAELMSISVMLAAAVWKMARPHCNRMQCVDLQQSVLCEKPRKQNPWALLRPRLLTWRDLKLPARRGRGQALRVPSKSACICTDLVVFFYTMEVWNWVRVSRVELSRIAG